MDEALMELAQTMATETAEGIQEEDGKPKDAMLVKEMTDSRKANTNTFRSSKTPSELAEQWAGGRGNVIYDEEFSIIGVGCYQREDGTVYWSRVFA